MAHLDFFLERIPTPLGQMLVVTDAQQCLRAVDWHDFEDRMHLLMRRQYRTDVITLQKYAGTTPAARAMQAYFEGELNAPDTLACALGGTDFQREVWAALREIPSGRTLSYLDLAKHIGRPAAVRAVGMANSANPISIAIPCHRVIGSNDTLTGYGGGLHRKQWLLAHENALPSPAPQTPPLPGF